MVDNLTGMAAYDLISDNMLNNQELYSVMLTAVSNQTEACVNRNTMVAKIITYTEDEFYFYIVFDKKATRINKGQYNYAVRNWNHLRTLQYKYIW